MCPHPIRDRDLRCIPFAWKVNIPAWTSAIESLLNSRWGVHDADMAAVREVYTVKHSTFKQIKYIKESKGPTLHETTCLVNIKNKINCSLCWYTSKTTASGEKHSVPIWLLKEFHCKANGRVSIFWTHLLNLILNGSSIKTRALLQNLVNLLSVYLQHSM